MIKRMDIFGAPTDDSKYNSVGSFIEQIVQDYKNSDERFDLSYYEKPNVKMKDGIFKYIFKEPEKFSELYYSFSGIKIPTDNLIRYDLDSELMFGLENDISFLTNDKSIIVLVEQQSTPSPNMPIRCMVYYSNLIRKLCEENKQIKDDMFSKFIHVPEPEFYILYNGTGEVEEVTSKLSDHFKVPFGRTENKKRHMIEIEIKNMDIHYNSLKSKKKKIVDYPFDLYGYSFLMDTYDYYKTELKKEKYKKLFYEKLGYSSADEINSLLLNNLINRRSLDLAIQVTKKKGYLVDYLKRKEFRVMLQEKMTLDEFKNIIKRQGEIEGEARGEARGKVKGEANLIQMMLDNGLSKSQISEVTGLSEETIENLLKTIK